MAEAAGEFCPALPGDGFYLFQRDAAGVVVDAQQGRVAVLDVGFFNAFLFFQRGNETLDTGVFFVGDFGEEEGDVELQFFHDEYYMNKIYLERMTGLISSTDAAFGFAGVNCQGTCRQTSRWFKKTGLLYGKLFCSHEPPIFCPNM